MSKSFVAADAASSNYSISDVLRSAVMGSKLTGYSAEISQELARKHGDEGIRFDVLVCDRPAEHARERFRRLRIGEGCGASQIESPAIEFGRGQGCGGAGGDVADIDE